MKMNEGKLKTRHAEGKLKIARDKKSAKLKSAEGDLILVARD